MTCSQWLTLVGGFLQVLALGLAWIVLFRFWKQRWPDADRLAAERLAAVLGEQLERVRYWLTLIPPPPPEPKSVAGRVEATSSLIGDATTTATGVVSGRTPEQRLDELERIETERAKELRDLRTGLEGEVAALLERQSAAQAIADGAMDDAEQRHTRFGLGWPASLAIVGTILQVWAAFACTHGVCFA
ncbi:hypothetical protein [Microbacterium sp. P5_E9]